MTVTKEQVLFFLQRAAKAAETKASTNPIALAQQGVTYDTRQLAEQEADKHKIEAACLRKAVVIVMEAEGF